jgi:hypothetical protein
MGYLDAAKLLRSTFTAKQVWNSKPEGNPIVNGCDLSKPGCVWTPYEKPKVRKR